MYNEVEAGFKDRKGTETFKKISAPKEFIKYIEGLGGAVDPSVMKLYQKGILPELNKLYPEGTVTLYRGTSVGHEVPVSWNFDPFSDDVILSFTEDNIIP